jgi:hypothetical protein
MKEIKVRTVIGLIILIMFSGCVDLEYPDDYEEDNYDPGRQSYGEDRSDSGGDPNYSITLFSQPNFRGRSQDYALQDGQRHLLVEFVGWDLNDKVGSIGIGQGVGVALFRDRNFGGPLAVYNSSTDKLDSDLWNFTSSIIVFDLDSGGPLGVWIGSGSTDIFSTNHQGRVKFLPMPENGRSSEARIRGLENFNDRVEWVILGPAPQNVIRRGNGRYGGNNSSNNRYSNRGNDRGSNRSVNLAATIHEHENFHGKRITLNSNRGDSIFMMKDYDFFNQASSVVISELW